MKKYLLLLLLLLMVGVAGCKKSTTIETNEKDGSVIVTIPADASAAELVNMQTALSNSLTIRAERERMAYEYASAKLRKSERQFYAVLVVVGVVTGIVSIFAITCGVLIWKFGGILK